MGEHFISSIHLFQCSRYYIIVLIFHVVTGIPPAALHRNIAVVTGKEVKLQCNISSTTSKKQWLKDDASIYSRDKLENNLGAMYSIETNHALHIKQAIMAHAGRYDCKDVASSAVWSVEITVIGEYMNN